MANTSSGKTIGVVDTPGNRKKIVEIKRRSSDVFLVPGMEISRLPVDKLLPDVLVHLEEFEWIFFTDIHAVDMFLETLEECGIDPFVLDNLTVCTFGEAVADRLRFVQLHADVIPQNLKPETIVETVENYIGDDDLTKSRKALFVTAGIENRTSMPIEDRFDEVVQIGVYKTELVNTSEKLKVLTLLENGAIDEFLFCSVEDVQNLLHLIFPATAANVLEDIEVLATDAITFQALRENGLTPRLLAL